MLNIEKVKHMTKAAAYENGPEKKNIGINNYFQADYLGLQMVKSGIAYTLAFGILAAMWASERMEELMLMLSRADYLTEIVKTLIILYVTGLVVYEIAVYIYYTMKYKMARQSVRHFHSHLSQIHKFYEEENSAETIIDLDKQADEEIVL